jgi:hypothetical protein
VKNGKEDRVRLSGNIGTVMSGGMSNPYHLGMGMRRDSDLELAARGELPLAHLSRQLLDLGQRDGGPRAEAKRRKHIRRKPSKRIRKMLQP